MIDWTGIALVITAGTSAVGSLVTLYRVGRVQADVAVVKHEANSMKDALVEATGRAREAKGREDMRAEQAVQATSEAKGRADEKADAAKTSIG